LTPQEFRTTPRTLSTTRGDVGDSTLLAEPSAELTPPTGHSRSAGL
jgi:hypothetical protein